MRIFPYKRLVIIALLSAPLFGLFGSIPALVIERIDFSRVPKAFLFITGITLIFWTINILLLWFTSFSAFLTKAWLRYLVSIVSSVIIMSVFFQSVRPKPVGPYQRKISQNDPQSNMIDSAKGSKTEMTLQFPQDSIFSPPPKRFIGPGPERPFIFPLIQAQSINIIIIFLMELILLRTRKEEIENENNLLHMANLEAKNNQLKQQLHPHFLFNSLNTLKSLIRRSPDEAEEYLLKLSGLLRYSTENSSKILVSLREELELCDDYLIMQQVRFRNSLHFYIDVSDDLMNKKVPVYSVQLLIENAIKHNITTASQPLRIEIKGNQERGTITVENNLQIKGSVSKSPGLGLSNLSERYKLLGIDGVDIKQSEYIFSVTIKTIEYEDSHH